MADLIDVSSEESKLQCLARWIAKDRCQGRRELVEPYFDRLEGRKPWKETGRREVKPIAKVPGLKDRVYAAFDELEAQAGKAGKERRGRELELELG